MRYSWTLDALERIHAQGVTPTEVQCALAGPGPRLIQSINGATRRVLARTDRGRLVEVWLRGDAADGEFEVWTAFEAGMVGHATWKNAFGDGE